MAFKEMEWNLFDYEEMLSKPKVQKKKYTEKEYREYIIENFKADYTNKVFFNIILDGYFSGHDWYEQEVEPKEQLAYLNGMMATYGEMARIDAEDRAYLAKIEREKERERYRHSKEYRETRAKKKAQRKLRKKSQGR